MKLWLIYRADCAYDEFDSAVVAAETAEAARGITPMRSEAFRHETGGGGPTWPNDLSVVSVRQIGFALPGTPEGLVLASFNAG